jgi:DNA-binding CsgD family transcriptional regulator
LGYAMTVFQAEGQLEGFASALNRALQIAEAASAAALIPSILAVVAMDAILRGHVEDGFASIKRGWALAQAAGDGVASLRLAVNESQALLNTARFQSAADAALRGLAAADQAGLATWSVSALAASASQALLAMGRTTEAASLIDPMTTGQADRDHYPVHIARAELDLLRGDTAAAAQRWLQITACIGQIGFIDNDREVTQTSVELALWAGRPRDTIDDVGRVLALFRAPDLTILCGQLLTAGMRASADLAEQARARLDQRAAEAAYSAADGLISWVVEMGGAPFADHPYVAAIPAERATWEAEQTRLAGASDPALWGGAAMAWQDLNWAHQAGYAWWRQAQAQLYAGQQASTAAAALRAASGAANGHEPLLAQIRGLAERARISLHPPVVAAATPAPPDARVRYGLTGRELAVLRLLAAGRTNAQIGNELYISSKTASVHVTSIFRKLGVSGRVQAAALAERAGLLEIAPCKDSPA